MPSQTLLCLSPSYIGAACSKAQEESLKETKLTYHLNLLILYLVQLIYFLSTWALTWKTTMNISKFSGLSWETKHQIYSKVVKLMSKPYFSSWSCGTMLITLEWVKLTMFPFTSWLMWMCNNPEGNNPHSIRYVITHVGPNQEFYHPKWCWELQQFYRE